MKYRYRIWLILLLIGLIPLVAAGLETDRMVNHIRSMPLDQTHAAVSDAAIEAVRLRFILTYTLFGIITLAAAYILSSRVASPIEWIAASASQFLRAMQKVWKSLHPPDTQDEIKTLSYTFNVFTQQIREEISNLEKQVEARTTDLAGRTAQLETAAQVARESAAILDIDQLLTKTTQLISDRFGYYHVGIFLLEESVADSDGTEHRPAVADSQTEKCVILQAANSEGGQRMLARGHKLKLGQGIVGTVAVKKEPRIATDVGLDAAFFNNPDLPQTRSELALPLRVRSKLIGVLDVQSTEPEAYQEEDIKILQILADQLALAIDNARLIKDSQRTLNELEIAYGQETKQAWEHRLAGPLAYAYNRIDVRPVSILQSGASGSNMTDADGVRTENASDDRPINTAGKSSDEDQYKMTVPILIRGQVLGNINLRRESELAPWNKDDRTLVEDAVVQIASALENARLLEEIRSRARQEQQINVISTQIRSSPTTDSILRNTVRELGNALGAYRTFIQLGVPTDEPGNVDLPTESTDDGKEHRG